MRLCHHGSYSHGVGPRDLPCRPDCPKCGRTMRKAQDRPDNYPDPFVWRCQCGHERQYEGEGR